MTPWLHQARREGWALGAFNANTLEQILAIVQAAAQEQAPAIIQISRRALLHAGSGDASLGLRILAPAALAALDRVETPIGLHLDHAPEHLILEALALGFTSVMFDGGDLPYQENIAATRRMVIAARAAGAGVEAELGEVPRMDGKQAHPPAELTDPATAEQFVRETEIDALAVSIGSVHAVQTKSVQLDLPRLEAISQRVSVPLVLHGSSGVSDDHILQAVRLGICKVNVATQLNQAFTGAVRACLAQQPALVDPRPYLDAGREAMRLAVIERMRLFGASHRWNPSLQEKHHATR